ncbi:uncharacterized protein LOC132045381 [Lycium ferocissimum]|uniref:uncharacterized protein LOC132045381 n=1 Tax=Lycium ferocissimum TaxID=112874 RepID=UPI0028164E19|nr:uncharacterized protein LOC132045381 [Lycium ferocissimum]
MEDISKDFIDYYVELLGTKNVLRKHASSSLIRTDPILTEEQRRMMDRPYTDKDVKMALWALDGNKALGPDGYGRKFFKDCWDIVGDFRPISCCNTTCKVISNMLCFRLKEVLPDIIADNQSAFVTGRTIVQNVLICRDLVRLYSRKNTTSSCLIKIDLRKAYDSVEWGFVEEMLYGLNFPCKYIKWIMKCISTPQYRISLNGGLHDDMLIFSKGEFTSVMLMLR